MVVATHELESVMGFLYVYLNETSARNDSALNAELEVLKAQIRIAHHRIEIAAQEWLKRKSADNIRNADETIMHLNDTLATLNGELNGLLGGQR